MKQIMLLRNAQKYFVFLFITFLNFSLRLLIINLKQKLNNKNKGLEGVFNNRYKMVKKLGEGAQGTVYEVEDLTENRKR